MAKTITTRYDVAEHLRTPEEMAAYLDSIGISIFIAYKSNSCMLATSGDSHWSLVICH